MLKKHYFGDDHEITYDTIINHDTYSYMRVSLEVPRGQDTKAIVVFNGKEVGHIIVTREGKKTIQYDAYRYALPNESELFEHIGTFTRLGKAVTAVISDFGR